MSCGQGHYQYHFSSGSLRGAAGCGGFTHAGDPFFGASHLHGGSSSAHTPVCFEGPIWLAPDARASWGGFGGSHGNLFMGRNEKQTMQELNDRLASYLEKVRSLEEANTQLEGCIREWHKKRSHGAQHDFKDYEHNILDMHERIETGRVTNASIVLQIDNAKMATEDFRLKYEAEKALRQSVQDDVENIRKELDNMTIIITDLEMEIEALREDNILKKKEHEEDMQAHGSSKEFSVNVKVKTNPQEDLAKILAEIRTDYETIIEKNRQSLDAWFQQQVASESLEETESPNQDKLQSSRKEINELNRTLQTLEIDFQTQLNKKFALENNLDETKSRYTLQLQSIQHLISKCEEELSDFRNDIKSQSNQYKVLFGIKTRLEKEISTYRQLLEGKVDGMTDSSSSFRESANQNLKKIVQETVDGQVVSTHTAEIKRQL